MYRFKKSLIALTGVLTLVAIVTVAVPHIGRGASGTGSNAPTSQTQNVNVVNTPSVNAQQSGTWNVGITGTPVVGLDAGNNTVKFDAVNNTVKVDPTNPLSIRDVDNPARQPFRKSVFVSFPDGATFAAINPGINPPAGKRLVIEAVSASGNIPSGQKFACTLNITDEFAQVLFNLDLTLTLQAPLWAWSARSKTMPKSTANLPRSDRRCTRMTPLARGPKAAYKSPSATRPTSRLARTPV